MAVWQCNGQMEESTEVTGHEREAEECEKSDKFKRLPVLSQGRDDKIEGKGRGTRRINTKGMREEMKREW